MGSSSENSREAGRLVARKLLLNVSLGLNCKNVECTKDKRGYPPGDSHIKRKF